MVSFQQYQKDKIKTIIFIISLLVVVSLGLFYKLSNYLQKSSYTNYFHWPYSTQANETLKQIQDAIDFKYCRGPCRFVNFLKIREQETRAQLHLRHLSFTAGLVNRTVVLPNVSGSRLGACLHYDFDYYYNVEWAENNRDRFNYITMKDFKSWLKERKSQGVPVEDRVLTIYDIADKDIDNPPPELPHCFSEYTISRPPFNEVLKWNTSKALAQQREVLLIDFLQGSLNKELVANKNQDLEVIHLELQKSNAFSHIEEANIPIPYSKDLMHFANITAASLGHYVAIHWRMEQAQHPKNLVHCAEHLTSLLQQISMNISQVMLLTDYPHTFTTEQQDLAASQLATQEQLGEWLQSTSDTFFIDQFTPFHHQAMQYLYQHHPLNLLETAMVSKQDKSPIKNWHLIPIPESLKKLNVTDVGGIIEMIDSGCLGILDKLIAIKSHEFLTVNPASGCGRGKSTFTAQIVAERALAGESKVHYFGQKINKSSFRQYVECFVLPLSLYFNPSFSLHKSFFEMYFAFSFLIYEKALCTTLYSVGKQSTSLLLTQLIKMKYNEC